MKVKSLKTTPVDMGEMPTEGAVNVMLFEVKLLDESGVGIAIDEMSCVENGAGLKEDPEGISVPDEGGAVSNGVSKGICVEVAEGFGDDTIMDEVSRIFVPAEVVTFASHGRGTLEDTLYPVLNAGVRIDEFFHMGDTVTD